MSSRTSEDRLTPSARLARGLKYSAVGPVDVTRGALGLGLDSAQSSASWVRNRYRRGRIASQLRQDFAIAQEALATELTAAQVVVAGLPDTIKGARGRNPRPRPWVLALAGAAVLGVGAVTFSIIRRSTQPDPSPLPPSVEVTPRP